MICLVLNLAPQNLFVVLYKVLWPQGIIMQRWLNVDFIHTWTVTQLSWSQTTPPGPKTGGCGFLLPGCTSNQFDACCICSAVVPLTVDNVVGALKGESWRWKGLGIVIHVVLLRPLSWYQSLPGWYQSLPGWYQSYERMILSAKRKFLKRRATSRSWRNNFWKSSVCGVCVGVCGYVWVTLCVCEATKQWSLTSGQWVPGDCIGDGREDPVKFAKGSSPVIQPTRDPMTSIPHVPQCVCRLYSMWVSSLWFWEFWQRKVASQGWRISKHMYESAMQCTMTETTPTLINWAMNMIKAQINLDHPHTHLRVAATTLLGMYKQRVDWWAHLSTMSGSMPLTRLSLPTLE